MTKQVEIFTDGACSGNPGPGGWGAILRFNGKTKELSGGEAETTNNRMELLAAISALNTTAEARPGLTGAAIHLDVIAAREVELLVVEPPRHVDVHSADTVVVVRNVVHERRDKSGDARAGRVGEILPDDAARVREPVRELARFRV